MIKPTILEKSVEDINNLLAILDAEIIQIDVADGILVYGETVFDPKELVKITSGKNMELDLMVENPLDYIECTKNLFSSIISQIRANDIPSFINAAKSAGLKVGLALQLDDPVSLLEDYIGKIDYVQFMGVIAGGQGRPFEPKVLEKIKEFKLKYSEIETQVDGHMTEETIPLVKQLGVDHFVVGSAIVKDANPQEKYEKLKNLF